MNEVRDAKNVTVPSPPMVKKFPRVKPIRHPHPYDRMIHSLMEGVGIVNEAGTILFANETLSDLLQSQKMEAIGRIAGGIAHDFNNILTAILGNAGLAEQVCDPRTEAAKRIRAIKDAADRAANLTRQLTDHQQETESESRHFQHQHRRLKCGENPGADSGRGYRSADRHR